MYFLIISYITLIHYSNVLMYVILFDKSNEVYNEQRLYNKIYLYFSKFENSFKKSYNYTLNTTESVGYTVSKRSVIFVIIKYTNYTY